MVQQGEDETISVCKTEGDAAVGDDELQLQPAPAAPRTSTTPVSGRTENHGQLLTDMNEGRNSYNKWQQRVQDQTLTAAQTLTENGRVLLMFTPCEIDKMGKWS